MPPVIVQGFPSLAVPVAAPDLTLTIPWYQFFRALWDRTGGGTGTFFIAEIDTGTGLKGGPANAAHPITTFTLDLVGSHTILSNISGVSAIPIGNSLTSILDLLGSARGDILYRNATSWVVLTPGTSGNFLKTNGAGADPAWASASFGSSIANNDILSNISGGSASPIGNTLTATIDSAIDNTQGDILYRNSSVWTALGPGTAGQFLQTGGASANPAWATAGLLGVQTFLVGGSPATYTPTTGTKKVFVQCQAAGGGGGGAATSGATTASLGSPGGGGGYCEKLITSSFSGVTVTTGAGGTAGTNAPGAGGAGGNSSFGALLTATGGGGGAAGAAAGVPPVQSSNTAGGGAASGTRNQAGGDGLLATLTAVTLVPTGGSAGGAFLASPIAGKAATGAGSAGTGNGGGGTGGLALAGSGNVTGGAGSDGIVVVYEYA